VILNNAGLMPHSPLERGKVEDWDRMIDVNLKGVLYGIAAALPHMTAQKSGHIINVSSVAGHKVRPSSAVSAAHQGGCAHDLGEAAPGGEALQHPYDGESPRVRSRPSCRRASPKQTSPKASRASTTPSRSRRTASREWSPSR
jgi:NAD(P)-dependent dehydrogenase (short-subunit alcohol dehydrogenase family)